MVYFNSRGEIRGNLGEFIANSYRLKNGSEDHVRIESYFAMNPQVGQSLLSAFNTPQTLENSIKNSGGSEQAITTLTTILADVLRQKVYADGINPIDYIPIISGEGNPYALSKNQWTCRNVADSLESGIINLASSNAQKGHTDIELDMITRESVGFVQGVQWNTMQAGVFGAGTQVLDYVTVQVQAAQDTYKQRFTKAAFIGLNSNTRIQGLLNQSNVTIDTTTITKKLNTMTIAEINTFVGSVVEAYRVGAGRTAMPDRFVIPETDWNGLGQFIVSNGIVATKTYIQIIEETFKTMTMNPNFKVLPSAYAMKENNELGTNKDRYVLYRYDKLSGRMDLDVPPTFTYGASSDGFNYSGTLMSKFTGFTQLRQNEMMYFDVA